MDFLGTPHDASRRRCLWCRGLTDVWLTGVAAQLGSENVDYSQEKAVIESGVESSMCGVNDNLASPMVLYSSILDQPWDKEYPSYVQYMLPCQCWCCGFTLRILQHLPGTRLITNGPTAGKARLPSTPIGERAITRQPWRSWI